MQKFIDICGKMNLAERALFFLGGLDDLEKGYRLILIQSRKKRYYLASIGNYHLCVFDYETGKALEDWGCCDRNKLQTNLNEFVKEYRIKEVSIE